MTSRCNICGSTSFRLGPRGRESSKGRPPVCTNCRSLERHRAVYDWIRPRNEDVERVYGSWSVLHFAPDRSINPHWFGRYEPSTFGDQNSLDIEKIARRSESYEMIILNHVLEHVGNEQSALSELVRIAKPKGLILITVPDPARRSHTELYPKPDSSGHHRIYGRDVIDRWRALLKGSHIELVPIIDPVTEEEDLAIIIGEKANRNMRYRHGSHT